MTRLRAHLLGRFSATYGDRSIGLQPTSAYLLALLALNLTNGLPRERAAGLLWPDLPESRARANLSTIIWRLRTSLSRQTALTACVGSSDDRVWAKDDFVETDLAEFLRGATALGARDGSLESLARAARAVELYRGDLLEGWDFEWCGVERQHLRDRYLDALKTVSAGFERRGRLDLALRYAKQAEAADPLDESIQRNLIRLHCDMGDRSSAISQFHRFARLVRSELGVEPDDLTLSLVEDVRRGPGRTGARRGFGGREGLLHPERVPLVGRNIERQILMEVLDTGLGGAGASILLIGDPGVGKSRIVEWAMEEWASRGGIVAQGRCIEFNEPMPYQPLLDALGRFVCVDDLERFVKSEGRHRTERASRMVVDTGVASSDERYLAIPGRLRLFAWLRGRLEQITKQTPLLLVLEDVQWADTSTLDFITYLSEHCGKIRLLLLTTSRSVAARVHHARNLERLTRHVGVVRRIEPLNEADSCELVRLLLGTSTVSSGLLTTIHTEAEGNPLFIIETLRLLQQTEELDPSVARLAKGRACGSTAQLSSLIPDGVRSIVEQRLALLSEDAASLAGIASVLGRSIEPEILGLVARMSENRLSRAVAELVSQGVLGRHRDDLRFSHDKVRAVCYERLSARARRRYHARCAAVLAGSVDATAHLLAWHQQAAGQWSVAAKSWQAAAEQAREVHAYEESVKAYEHALACVKRDKTLGGSARAGALFGLTIECVRALSVLGRPSDRLRLLREAEGLCLRFPADTNKAAWLLEQAMVEDHIGNHLQAVGLSRRAWSLARFAGHREEEIRALRMLAWALNRGGRLKRSILVSKLALRKLAGEMSPERASVLAEGASTLVKLCDYVVAAEWIGEAKRNVDALGRAEASFLRFSEALVQKWTGNLMEARQAALEVLSEAQSTGDRLFEGRILFQLATIDSLQGNLGSSLLRIRQAREILHSAAYSRIYTACLNEVAYGIGRQIGNYGWAWDASELAVRSQGNGGYTLAVYLDSQAQLLADQRSVQEALAKAGQALRLLEGSFCSTTQHLETLARRGAALLLAGEIEQAHIDLSTAAVEQRSRGDRLLLPNTLTYLALTYAELGDAEQAIATSEEAVRVLTEVHFANHQPQRIFWHHYLLLTRFGREPRLPALRRAVELVEAQAATLSRAQQRRFRHDVQLNRDILEAWNALQAPASMEQPRARNAAHTTAAAVPA